MALLSKIKIGEVIYDLKDAQARADLKTILGEHAVAELGAAAWKSVAANISGEGLVDASIVKNYVDSQVGQVHSFDVVIDATGTADGPSVAASASTMYKIYMVPDAQASAGAYIEWITIRNGAEGSYTYTWEKIGSTKTDLTGYVSKNIKIAGIELSKDISVAELQTALGLKALAYKDSATGTVAGQTISGVRATGTSAGELTGALGYAPTKVASEGVFTPTGTIAGTVVPTGTVSATQTSADAAATLTKADYTPEGNVTINPAMGTVKAIKSVGTKPTFTEGAFTAATLVKSDKTFATAGVVASIDAADTEMLVLTAAGTDTASAITSFNGGSKAADFFSAGNLPEVEDASVMTGVTSSEFTGTKAEGALVTGVTYSKAGAITATFTGNANGDAIDATFNGAQGDIAVSGNYDKANLGTVAFKGGETSLSVDDIIVAAKEVTVE